MILDRFWFNSPWRCCRIRGSLFENHLVNNLGFVALLPPFLCTVFIHNRSSIKRHTAHVFLSTKAKKTCKSTRNKNMGTTSKIHVSAIFFWCRLVTRNFMFAKSINIRSAFDVHWIDSSIALRCVIPSPVAPKKWRFDPPEFLGCWKTEGKHEPR